MRYESIADIYSANEQIRRRLIDVLAGITEDEAVVCPDGEGWSVQQTVEHLSIVGASMLRICQKLTAAARDAGIASDGSFALDRDFAVKTAAARDVKIDAPERVKPTGGVPIAEALEHLLTISSGINDLRPDLEGFDQGPHRFPHPFFGDMTAPEWIIVAGGHEARHTGQIERVLASVRR